MVVVVAAASGDDASCADLSRVEAADSPVGRTKSPEQPSELTSAQRVNIRQLLDRQAQLLAVSDRFCYLYKIV